MRIDGHVASQLVAVLAWLSRQRREVLCITSEFCGVECVSVLFLSSLQPLSSARGFVVGSPSFRM